MVYKEQLCFDWWLIVSNVCSVITKKKNAKPRIHIDPTWVLDEWRTVSGARVEMPILRKLSSTCTPRENAEPTGDERRSHSRLKVGSAEPKGHKVEFNSNVCDDRHVFPMGKFKALFVTCFYWSLLKKKCVILWIRYV